MLVGSAQSRTARVAAPRAIRRVSARVPSHCPTVWRWRWTAGLLPVSAPHPPRLYLPLSPCPGGGIGRRRGLKIPHPSGYTSSSLVPGICMASRVRGETGAISLARGTSAFDIRRLSTIGRRAPGRLALWRSASACNRCVTRCMSTAAIARRVQIHAFHPEPTAAACALKTRSCPARRRCGACPNVAD